MTHPHPSLYSIPDGTAVLPEPPEGEWEPCAECGAIGTVPAFKPDPANPKLNLAERFSDHARGSGNCPSCGATGWTPAS